MLAGAIGACFALSRASSRVRSARLLMVLPFYLGLGFTHANALQIVMRPFPHMAGQASAWLGLLQQVGGVVVSVIAVQGRRRLRRDRRDDRAAAPRCWLASACAAALLAEPMKSH